MAHLTRRHFNSGLFGAAALGTLPAALPAAPENTSVVARPGDAQLAPVGQPKTQIWGYDGAVPGPVLRVPQGRRLTRDLHNELPQATSIHWHGVRIENAMDGVVGLTQDAVAPGDTFRYDFALPDAGTYWYHPHNRTWEQMARGLYGALIVAETAQAPEVDADEALLIDDWRLGDTAQIAGGFGTMHDASHAGRIGNWITVNGQPEWTHTVRRHDRLRLRLVNTANARLMTLETRGLDGWVVALDGMPLDAPEPLSRMTLAPSQRADVIVDVTANEAAEAYLVSIERAGGYAIAAFPVVGETRAARLDPPAPLPPNPITPITGLDEATQLILRMEGGAMGGMRQARMGGHMTPIRDLAAAGKVWAFNGMADMDETPLVDARLGQTLRIAMTNDTAWPHAMHLHGHHFRQILDGGALGPLRDTLLVHRGDTAEIAFVADNPGDWLLHCHMLEHAAAGMMTWLRVS